MFEHITKEFSLPRIHEMLTSGDIDNQRHAMGIIHAIEERYKANAVLSRTEINIMLYFAKQHGKYSAKVRTIMENKL